MACLLQHRWPGNVRELENSLERAMVLSDSDLLKLENFPIGLGAAEKPLPAIEQIFEGYSLKNAQKVLEKEMITKALLSTEGNRTQAARLLEISHPSLLSKMKAYGIDL